MELERLVSAQEVVGSSPTGGVAEVECFRVTGEVTPMTVRHELHKLTEMGLPTDHGTAMAYLRQVFGEEAASVDQALLEREFWAWWTATD